MSRLIKTKVNRVIFVMVTLGLAWGIQSCGVYSFTGAAIEGKTIQIQLIENLAPNVVPTLSATFTQKLRQRIISQTSLSPLNSENSDYIISGVITTYDVSIASISGNETTSKSRLTIAVKINFKNKLNEKANFEQMFTRFKDFNADQNIQTIEAGLISEISEQLADDIFNKAFVNW